LQKVFVELLEFHSCNEVFISGVIVLVMGADIFILVARGATETVRIPGEDFADDEPSTGPQEG
jgi:hypothetical protein